MERRKSTLQERIKLFFARERARRKKYFASEDLVRESIRRISLCQYLRNGSFRRNEKKIVKNNPNLT